MTSNLAIIICTRNRANSLELLLKSISQSIIKPAQIVLVSSGNDVSSVVSLFGQELNILHEHTEKIGQSNQKIIGIALLENKINWVFFLDDDLLLLSDTLNNALEKINDIGEKNIVGIGTQIISLNNPISNESSRKNRFFKRRLGKILTSGRATSYQNSETVQTEWLNGASIWNKNVLREYQLPILNSKYAAYEDVIFSTKVNKSHKLVYEPQIKIIEQLSNGQMQPDISAYSYINLWTGYFVCIDSRTRLPSFKILVTFRFIRFFAQKFGFRSKNIKDINEAFILTCSLIRLPNNKNRSIEIIQVMIKNQTLKNL
jgi:glycosyltransferase involved in cell wall biosynthesis